MSFKCSLFGCSYGDSEIERDREEDGSEVITTITETQTCKRCGDTRIVSENKEVTTLETAADIVADDLQDEPAPEDSADDVEEPAAGVAEPANGVEEPATEPPQDPAQPAPADSQAAAEPPIPDAETGEVVTTPPEETVDPDPETDDGVILEDDEPDEPEREPGEWPQESTEEEDDWKPETEVDPILEETTVEPTGSAVTVPEGEFHCPECEFTTPVEESSLRAGDFCPECHRGALEHVTE